MAKTRKDHNRCEFKVRLTKDARYVAPTSAEGTNARLYFTGACNAGYQTADGKDVTRFIEFVIKGTRATSLKDFLKKGTALEIRDSEFEVWQKQEDGKYVTNYAFDVIKFDFADGGKKEGETTVVETPAPQPEPQVEVQEEVVGIEISDGELPF